MPELPEVEIVCRYLAPILVGHSFTEVKLRRNKLRFDFPDNFATQLIGKKIHSVKRRAKFILIALEEDIELVIHLGMSGTFRVCDSDSLPFEQHEHVIFFTSNDKQIRYHDPRRFGFMEITSSTKPKSLSFLAQLGPEPLKPPLSGASLASLIKGRKGPIKSTLLNQKVIAGIGNIYASEALNLAGVSPKRKTHNLGRLRSAKLAQAIVKTLNLAIEVGGSTLKDFRKPSGEMGYFQNQFRVYNREGKDCPNCGNGYFIKKIFQAGRATFYCSKCQR